MCRYSLLLCCLLLAFSAPAFARMEESPFVKLPPKEILASIYKPLSGPLAALKKNLKADRNYMVWVHVPAQHPLDLRSAEHFRRWALGTPVTEMTISHNMVAFRCKNESGQFVEGATGMTGASRLQEIKALLKGYGLNVFFGTFTDGHLNPQAEVGDYITKNHAKRGAVYAAFEVSQEQCAGMQDFLVQFVNHPRKPYNRFNTIGDPEKFEGGGCVTFARTLMKKANVLSPVLPLLYREFTVARFMLGGNLKQVEDFEPMQTPWLQGKRRSISLNMFWSTPWEMAPEGMPGYLHLRQIDPEKIVWMMRQFANVFMESASPADRNRAAVMFNRSPLQPRFVVSANNLADPGGPYEWTRTKINESFDPGMAQVGKASRAYFRGEVAAGKKMRVGSVNGMPVLILENP